MRTLIGFQILAISTILSVNAWAYGTIRKNGLIPQNLEHERITRRAYSCKINDPIQDCISKKTLNKLAGKKRFFYGTYGGVGYPDKLFVTKIDDEEVLSNYDYLDISERPKLHQNLPDVFVAHCDGGDHLSSVEGYPRTADQAKNLIVGCRQWMNDHFMAAVNVAAGLVNDGKIVVLETKLQRNCISWQQTGSTAKCNVLTHFGIMLHASQDFYSHSNWNDKPDEGDLTSTNPPGLGKTGSAPWLKMPISNELYPEGLISGCWGGWPEKSHCEDDNSDGVNIRRSKHADLNKDSGVVDPKTNSTQSITYEDVGEIGPGNSARGKINENFERSVHATIIDTRLKLKDFKTALESKYGTENATLMFCAVIKDKPSREC